MVWVLFEITYVLIGFGLLIYGFIIDDEAWIWLIIAGAGVICWAGLVLVLEIYNRSKR
jgi:hypothetical protein